MSCKTPRGKNTVTIMKHENGDDTGAAGGGRPLVKFGLCGEKFLELLSIIMMVNVGYYLVASDNRNVQTISLPLNTGEVMGGRELITTSVISTPGLWGASMIQSQSYKYYGKTGRLNVCRDDVRNLGFHLVNQSDVVIAGQSTCNAYTGYFTADDSNKEKKTSSQVLLPNIYNPSDRKINTNFTVVSSGYESGNPKTFTSNGDEVEESELRGAEMLEKFPPNLYGGREICEHSCSPNAFLSEE
jgi:hypothetical protein